MPRITPNGRISPAQRIQAQQVRQFKRKTTATDISQQVGAKPLTPEQRPSIVPKQLTQEEIDTQQAEAKAEAIAKDVEKIDEYISKRQAIITGLKQSILEKRARNENTDERERQLSFEQRFLSEYQTAKQNILKGFSFSSSVAVAEARATGFQERTELRAREGITQQQEVKAKIEQAKIDTAETERLKNKIYVSQSIARDLGLDPRFEGAKTEELGILGEKIRKESDVGIVRVGGISNISQLNLETRPYFAKKLGFEPAPRKTMFTQSTLKQDSGFQITPSQKAFPITQSYIAKLGFISASYSALGKKLREATITYKGKEIGVGTKYWPTSDELLGSTEYRQSKLATTQEDLGAIGLTKWEQKIAVDASSYFKGLYGGIQEKPEKAVVTAGLFFLLPPFLKGVGKVFAPLATAFPGTTAVLSKTISYGAPLVYASSIGYRTYQQEKGQRAEFLGSLTSTEIIPMGVGTYAGTKFWPKAGGYLATLGRKEVPIKDLVPEEVLLGKKKFVESGAFGYKGAQSGKGKQAFDIKVFKKYQDTFHATPGKYWWRDMKVVKGTSEFPGLYTAPKVSPYFLKVQGGSSAYGGSVFNPYGTPAVAKFRGLKFTTSPTGQTGTAFVTGTKPEIEAVIQVGTGATKQASPYFFKWKGQRIPIDIFQVSTTGAGTGAGATSVAEISSSYGAPSSAYLSTPGSFLTGSFFKSSSSKTFKSSKPYYQGSSVASLSRTSYAPSSKISSSKISYRGSSVSSLSKRTSGKISSSISRISSPSSRTSYAPSTPGSSISRPSSINTFYQKYDKQKPELPRTKRQRQPTRELFKTFIIKGGKKQYLAGLLPKGLASQKGAGVARKTLRATFGIEPTGRRTRQRDITFKPSKEEFRGYRKKKGKKIPLKNLWIQRRERRLSAFGEVKEIQALKKFKGKKKKKRFKISKPSFMK